MTLWNDALIKSFLIIIKGELGKGKSADTADNGVRKENWTKINSKFNGTNQKNYTKPQLQSCYSALKIKYTTLKTLREQSGFGWDDDKQLPTAPDEVWNAYIEKNAKAKSLRYQTFTHYDICEEIFIGKIATGQFATSSANNLIIKGLHDLGIHELDDDGITYDNPFILERFCLWIVKVKYSI